MFHLIVDANSNRYGLIENWRLGSLRTRTLSGPVIILPYPLPFNDPNSKPRRTFRNPLVVAMELKAEMRKEGLTQAELARRHGMTRARVNQWLSLLKLPAGERQRILAMGDHWERRVVTERKLRCIYRKWRIQTQLEE